MMKTFLVVVLLASVMLSQAENVSSNLEDTLTTKIDFVLNEFVEVMNKVFKSLLNAIISVSRALYVCLLVIGVVLHFSRINRRLGKDLIVGGLILAFIIEFILPVLPPI